MRRGRFIGHAACVPSSGFILKITMKLPKPPDSANDSNTPKSKWDKIVTSTPVVMTILATLLAGLSSSESNLAQYYRSLSAQNQSKAGDQWNFFQAKKLRSANSTSAVKLLRNLGDVGPLTTDSITIAIAHLVQNLKPVPGGTETGSDLQTQLVSLLADADVKKALEVLTNSLPPIEELAISDPIMRNAYETLKKNEGEAALPESFGTVSADALRDALHTADNNSKTSDAVLRPAVTGLSKIEKLLDQLATVSVSRRRSTTQSATRRSLAATDRESPGEVRQLAADFTVAELRFDAARQDREAKLNQQSAYLYEVAVRKTSWQSDRSLVRSRYFFYGMLGAQAAVLIATFSLAVRERSWMWSIAASIGVLAMAYAGYVYLYT